MAGYAPTLRNTTWPRDIAAGGRTAAPKGPGGEGTRSGAVLHRTAQHDRGDRDERNLRDNFAGSLATGCSRPLECCTNPSRQDSLILLSVASRGMGLKSIVKR